MSQLFAMAIPILPGKFDQFKDFLSKLNNEYFVDFMESRKKFGIREQTFLQRTPMGDFVIATFEGNNPSEFIRKVTESNDTFTRWFIEQVKDIHGINLKDALPAMPELVIDSNRAPR